MTVPLMDSAQWFVSLHRWKQCPMRAAVLLDTARNAVGLRPFAGSSSGGGATAFTRLSATTGAPAVWNAAQCGAPPAPSSMRISE